LAGNGAAETVVLDIDGAGDEMDLGKKNAASLRKALAEFGDKRAPRQQRRPTEQACSGGPSLGATPAMIRGWAAQ